MEQPQHQAWVNLITSRFYAAHVMQDMFGDWTLRKVWGGIGSRRGGMSPTGLGSYEEGVEQLQEIAKRRGKRGYRRVLAP
jgi:hypothetical protein